jgi:hypothetical protein
LVARSPLSLLEEVELMRLGLEGKAAGWRTLRKLAERDQRLDSGQLDNLIERARSQSQTLADPRQPGLVLANGDAEGSHHLDQLRPVLCHFECQPREDDASRSANLRCCSATGQFGARRRAGKMIIQVNTEQPRSGCLTVLVSAHCLNLPQHLDLAFFALSGRVYARGSAAQAAGGAYPATARCRVCRQLVLALLNYSRRPF